MRQQKELKVVEFFPISNACIAEKVNVRERANGAVCVYLFYFWPT
jgi:hypothetical protein